MHIKLNIRMFVLILFLNKQKEIQFPVLLLEYTHQLHMHNFTQHCTHTHAHKHTHTCTRTHTHTHTNTHTHAHAHTHTHAHKHTHTCTRTHTHTHTHSCTMWGLIYYLLTRWWRVCRMAYTQKRDFNPLTGEASCLPTLYTHNVTLKP